MTKSVMGDSTDARSIDNLPQIVTYHQTLSGLATLQNPDLI